MAPLTEFEQFLQALGLLDGPALEAQDIPYAGFDNTAYPGKDFMDYFRANTNMVFALVYLDGTGHTGTDWQVGTPDITTLQPAASRWGIGPVYFGSQAATNEQGPHVLTLARALSDANKAVAGCAAATISAGAVIYFDWEATAVPVDKDKDYIKAWAARVSELGYRVGIYCHPAAAPTFRDLWPGTFIWITRVSIPTGDAFIRPSSQSETTLVDAPDPQTSKYADAVAWQFSFAQQPTDIPKPKPFAFWPADVLFPPYAGSYVKQKPAFVQTGPTAGRPLFDMDINSSSLRSPGFPEQAMAPALVRSGIASVAMIDASTLAIFAVRKGALSPMSYAPPTPLATFLQLDAGAFAFNPFARHSSIQRGANGDLGIVVRPAVRGSSDDAWQINAYRRRGSVWTVDEDIAPATMCEPLAGVCLVSRAPDSVEALFVERGNNQPFVVATTDAATQADDQPWQDPQIVPGADAPFGISLLSGISAVSRHVDIVDAFIVGQQGPGLPWQLNWTNSLATGSWLGRFSVPGDPSVQVHPSSNVACISRDTDLLNVFAVAKGPSDTTWTLYTWRWDPTGQWGVSGAYHTNTIPGSVVSPHPVCKVRAVSRTPQFIDVFVVGFDDGLLYNAFWDASTNVWSDFRQVGTGSKPVLVQTIDAAIARDANNVDVVVTGRDGNVYISSWNATMAAWPALTLISALSVV